jgi:N-acetylglutamate synthase-like GNAT family acetyltransferase
MNDPLEIRQATRDDLPSIYRLTSTMYTTWNRSADFLKWLCFETVVPTVLMCAFYREAVVGMFGVQKRRLTNGALCGQAIGLNIAPDWQGKRIFTELGKKAFAHFSDLDVISVFANANARQPCERSFGMQTIGILHMIVLDDFRAIARPEGLLSIQQVTAHTVFPDPDYQPLNSVAFVYDSAYRSWRFGQRPQYSYALLRMANNDFAVVKLFEDPASGAKSGDIVDYACSPDRYDNLEQLLSAVCWHLKDQGASRVNAWAAGGQAVQRAFAAFPFRKSSSETYFGFRTLNSGYSMLSDFAAWHLRLADATNY